MLVGGQTGNPRARHLTYVLPNRRTDFFTGKSLVAKGFMLSSHGLSGRSSRIRSLNFGASDGGEASLSPAVPSEFPETTISG